MNEQFKIKPYARLITMLGDQLIKNELVAIVELVKNAYDADADWAKITFVDFNNDFSANSKSKIIIEDDGYGMSREIIVNHWLNPATPDKKIRKSDEKTTKRGRIMQGEKGIGRFAIFKLGKKITITSRRENESLEGTLIYDFSKYDEDFLTENNENKQLFLEDLNVDFYQHEPQRIIQKDIVLENKKTQRKPNGTIIEISCLKGRWSKRIIDNLTNDFGKMQPIFFSDNATPDITVNDFNIYVYKDDEPYPVISNYNKTIADLIDRKAVLKVTDGLYDENNAAISFNINGEHKCLDFYDSEINRINIFENEFKNPDYKTECGNFKFQFYVFDFMGDSESKYYLSRDEKNKIKEHRIYLYRDGMRVFPYGNPEDDWLQIDVLRGTSRASDFLSNNQVIGCVFISQEENRKLKDKTNREGLIEEGQALFDFTTLLRIILKYIRKSPYEKYNIEKKKKIEFREIQKDKPQKVFYELRYKISNNHEAVNLIDTYEKAYKIEKNVLHDRIKKVENLAAVGLSVETASHDVMLLLKKAIEQLDNLAIQMTRTGNVDIDSIYSRVSGIRGTLGFVESQTKDIQLLFPSTKTKTKNLKIKEIIDKVVQLYNRAFRENNIRYNVFEIGSPLIVKTTDAVLLQVFINLFDNALYWLKYTSDKKVEIYLNGNENQVVFSDNGPGIKNDDLPYIFEAFFSGKGDEGRGLGLYIARQLLERYDYSINVAEFNKDKKLSGANFVIDFVKNEV